MAAFVLKKKIILNLIEKLKHQISGTAIGTKFAPTYAFIFMDEIETIFFDAQGFKSLVWFQYIHDVLFNWAHGKEELEKLLKDFNNCHPNIKFTHSSVKKTFSFRSLR